MTAATRRRRSWPIFLSSFALFALFGTVWNLAQPPLSGADEPEHLLHAEAVWSGQWVPPLDPALYPAAQFQASKVVVSRPKMDGCFIADAAVPASCARGSILQGPGTTGPVGTYVGREPPLPMLLFGLPVSVSPTRLGLYLSRFLVTLFGAAALALALTVALTRRRVVLSAGVVLAATPAVVAEWGVLGSSQLEIGSALVAWTCLALLVKADGRDPSSTPPDRSLVALLTVAATLMVLSRPVSFVYVALMAIAVGIAVPVSRLRSLWSHPAVRVCVGVVSAATVLSLCWYFLFTAPANPRYLVVNHLPHITSFFGRLSVPVGQTRNYWLQAVGATGFNEYNGPWWVTLGWTGLLGFAVGVGLLFARLRRVLAAAALIVALLALPVVTQAFTLPKLYLYWQGRYDVPILIGIVVVAVAGLDAWAGTRPQLRRAVVPVTLLIAALQILELAGTLRRYVVGLFGNLDPFEWGHGWHPPLPALALLFGGAAVAAAAYGTVLAHQCVALRPVLPDGTGR